MTRNRIFVIFSCMVLTSLVAVGAMYIYLIQANHGVIPEVFVPASYLGGGSGAGAAFSDATTLVLGFFVLGYVPIYTGVRMLLDRKQLPLVFCSAISTGKMVRGKLASAAALSLLIIALGLPIVMFAVTFRGVDVLSIFIDILTLFFMSIAISQVALWAGSLPGKGMLRSLGLLPIILLSSCALFSGLESSDYRDVDSIVVLLFLGISLLLLQLSSSALLKSADSNRFFLLRIVFIPYFFIATYLSDDIGYYFNIEYLLFQILIIIIAAFILCEPTKCSGSVRKKITKNPVLRILSFPFYTGSANGMIWLTGIVVGQSVLADTLDVDNFCAAGMYLLIYAQVAILLHYRVFRWAHSKIWMTFVAVIFIFNIAPILSFFFSGRAYGIERWLLLGSLFQSDQYWYAYFLLGFIALVPLIYLNWRIWWLLQFQTFKPLEEVA